jgi:hypothetical protein
MENPYGTNECSAKDLTGRRTAWFLWYAPIIVVIGGSGWSRGRAWLWIPAFLVMGIGCLANAARCGRIHCYVTGPLFPLAAVYVALSGFGIVPLHPGLFLLVVFGLAASSAVRRFHSASIEAALNLRLKAAKTFPGACFGAESHGSRLPMISQRGRRADRGC